MSYTQTVTSRFPDFTFHRHKNKILVYDNHRSARFTLWPENSCECECWAGNTLSKFSGPLESCVEQAFAFLHPPLDLVGFMGWLTNHGVAFSINVWVNSISLHFDQFDAEFKKTSTATNHWSNETVSSSIIKVNHDGVNVGTKKFQSLLVHTYGL